MRLSPSSLLSYFYLRQTRRSSSYRCIELIKRLPELHSRERSKLFVKPTEPRARISGSERKGDGAMPIESLSLICFAAHERNRTNFNCLRTYRDQRERVKKLAEGGRIHQRVDIPAFGKRAVGNFLVLSRSGYPLILPIFPVFRRL